MSYTECFKSLRSGVSPEHNLLKEFIVFHKCSIKNNKDFLTSNSLKVQ